MHARRSLLHLSFAFVALVPAATWRGEGSAHATVRMTTVTAHSHHAISPTPTASATSVTPPPVTATSTATALPPSATAIAATATPAPSSTPTPVNAIALGAYVPGSPWDGGTALDAYNALVGYKAAVVNWYEDWPSTGFSSSNFTVVASRGEMPLLSWNPCHSGLTIGGNPCSDALIAGTASGGVGVADTYLHQFARAAAVWGKPFYLRFAWEMNGTWSPYGVGVNGNTAADYIAMWRHVHAIFAAEGAADVRWLWCPNVLGGASDFSSMYPGDAYVDDVGLDGYNWGTSQTWSMWTSFATIFGASYNELTAMTSKPVIIAETASSEIGGDKASWITEGFLSDVPARFPRVKAIVWFDANKETDWRVNSSASSLTAYQQVATSAPFQGHLP